MNIPTAEEFIPHYLGVDCNFMESMREQLSHCSGFNFDNIPDFMIEFAKLHVQAQAEAIKDKAQVEFAKDWIRKEDTIKPNSLISSITVKVNEDSILNAYPLTNIK